ncbi:hypothetical protein BGZ57DRAFT_951197 [Hyaloscypha finlandica]|nr:hypothetical protein F5882DRAFT_72520 [Hyaloscypha sp. PMI_1271]KAH8784362.1 hypothetical protein BGZ57DRAFT_951197 [Hyaloscypha finlandica]
MAPMPYQILRDDFKLSTLLYMGAFIQAVLFLIAPHRIVAMPVILTLAGLVTKNILIRFGFIRDPSFDRVYVGRTTAQIVNDDGSVPENGCDKEIVVFLLGSCTNNAIDGRFDSDTLEVRDMFGDMWKELSDNREKWGFIGKTGTLLSTDVENTNSAAWISYWRSLEHLQAFAQAEAHQKGLNWYMKGKHPSVGIMHETYVVPAGNWETIYHNFVPFGLGQAKQPFKEADSMRKKGMRAPHASGLMEAKGPTWKSMKSRMKKLTTEKEAHND